MVLEFFLIVLASGCFALLSMITLLTVLIMLHIRQLSSKREEDHPRIFVQGTATESAIEMPAIEVPVPDPHLEARKPAAVCGFCQGYIFEDPIRSVVVGKTVRLIYECPNCKKEVAVKQPPL